MLCGGANGAFIDLNGAIFNRRLHASRCDEPNLRVTIAAGKLRS
jgi:hypothetical protein